MEKNALGVTLCLLFTSAIALAELEPETLTTQRLPVEPNPHWVWVNDINFYSLLDGKAYLIDGDSGRFLGMLGLGYFHTKILFPADANEIYTTETYYSRGTRGERTDLIGIYDARDLKPIGEVVIPNKRLTGIPTQGHTAITDADRFILIYNFTPAQSITIVDLKARKTLGEIETPGCSLVYPTGSHRFFMICGDGSLISLQLDDRGRETARTLTEPVFDPSTDPIEEDGFRIGNQWSFVSREGYVYTFNGDTPDLALSPPWSLLNDADRKATSVKAKWKPPSDGGRPLTGCCSGGKAIRIRRGTRRSASASRTSRRLPACSPPRRTSSASTRATARTAAGGGPTRRWK